MFIGALFTIAKIWKKLSVYQQMNGKEDMVYVETMKYYSTIKKNEFLPFASTQMDLECNILSEISQRMANTV